MKQIKLTNGGFTLVDNQDFEWLSQWNWQLHPKGYVHRSERIKGTKLSRTILMHREILKTPQGFDTDHKDRNRLNNQRNNLRIATQTQNMMNTSKFKNNTSGRTGVYWEKRAKKWLAKIQFNYKIIGLGYYSNLSIACLARKWGERLYFREFAVIGGNDL